MADASVRITSSPALSVGFSADEFIAAAAARLDAHPDAKLAGFRSLLLPLIASAASAIDEWYYDGGLSPTTVASITAMSEEVIDAVPIDYLDELSVILVLTVSELHPGDLRLAEAAQRASFLWYESFWPFEHPEAVIQALRFGSVAKVLPAPVFMANEHDRITFSSTELDRLMGVPRGFNERLTISELFGTRLRVGRDNPTDVSVVLNDVLHHLQLTLLPIRTDTGTGYFGYVRDRTYEVTLEQMRNGVVGAISHELRTPLTAIVGYLELLASLDPVEQAEALDVVRSESQLLLRLVNRIVDFSKLSSGTAAMRFERFLVEPEVTAALRRILVDAGDGSFVDLDIAPDLEIDADRDRFGQLITNLLTNALRYGGPHVSVSGTRDASGVRLIVQDNGPGIPARELQTIFDPFVQGMKQHKGSGAGLGLAICSGIMASMGGRLDAENDAGAKFTAWFPVTTVR